MHYSIVDVHSHTLPCRAVCFGLNTQNSGKLVLPHQPLILEKLPAARTMRDHEFFRGIGKKIVKLVRPVVLTWWGVQTVLQSITFVSVMVLF